MRALRCALPDSAKDCGCFVSAPIPFEGFAFRVLEITAGRALESSSEHHSGAPKPGNHRAQVRVGLRIASKRIRIQARRGWVSNLAGLPRECVCVAH